MTALHTITPLVESTHLSAITGCNVYLKLECVQPTGSFKLRGIGNACRASCADKARALVGSSGGNAGLAMAYSGRHLGVPVTIVVPESTPQLMQDRLRAEGARVIQHGAAWDDSHALALEIADKEQAAYIHPFDDPRIWAGHASLVHEVKDTGIEPDLVVTVVGGGGLLCGILTGLHEVGWSHVPVMTMETAGAASFALSVRAGRLVTLDRITSVATSLGAKTVSAAALEWTSRHELLAHTTTDRSAVAAVMRFADDHRLLVEPACGAALAAIYEKMVPPQYKRILVVVCGGAGVTTGLIEQWRRRFGLDDEEVANQGAVDLV